MPPDLSPRQLGPDDLLAADVERAGREANERLAAADQRELARLVAVLAALPMDVRPEPEDARTLAAVCARAGINRTKLALLISTWREVERFKEALRQAEEECEGLPDFDGLLDQLRVMDADLIEKIDGLLTPKRVLLAAIEQTAAILRKRESVRATLTSFRREYPVLFARET
jgi:hypothetical protein